MGNDKKISWDDIYEGKRRQRIARILQAKSFDVAAFTIEKGRLQHKATGEFFEVGDLKANYARAFQFKKPGSGLSDFYYGDESKIDEKLAEWCVLLSTYLAAVEEHNSAPDLFSEVARSDSAVNAFALAVQLENFAITESEQKLIADRLKELENYVVRQSQWHSQLSEEQFAKLGSQMRYLEEASSRVGRKDWLNILIAVLITLVGNGLYSPERGSELLRHALSLFRFLVDQGPSLLIK